MTAFAQVQLTDVVVFGADSTGNWFRQPNVWETRTGGSFNVWIQSGEPNGNFLTGPSDEKVRPNITLDTGEISFSLYGAPGASISHFGINLFFNSLETPSISAFGPMLTSATETHTFAADAAPNTPKTIPGFNTGYAFPGAGTLSFVSGEQVITLTDFYWATPSAFGLDLVRGDAVQPDGVNDFAGGITLAVTAVPEPKFTLWVVACLSALPVLFKCRRVKKSVETI